MVFGAILLVTGASLTATVVLLQVAVLPLVFKYSKSVQRKMVFSNCINFPRHCDYDHPSSCDIVGGRNFSVEFISQSDDCPIRLGVWHIIPTSLFEDLSVIDDDTDLNTRLHNELKQTSSHIVLYCHGNSSHRASPHRLQMYKVLQELNFHIIAFDYRGYGDSTNVRPTERGVVEDCFHVYSWLMDALKYNPNKPMVLLWGHSLGTAVASSLVANLPSLCKSNYEVLPMPHALVLESAFNNLTEEIESHPLSKFVSWLPYYKDTFVKPFTVSSEYDFTTDVYLTRVTDVPLLMLHCVGDRIVPYPLAVKLHESVLESRRKVGAPLMFHVFERGRGLGHNNICEAKDLPIVIRNFLITVENHEKSTATI